jgi:hypothetical protein
MFNFGEGIEERREERGEEEGKKRLAGGFGLRVGLRGAHQCVTVSQRHNAQRHNAQRHNHKQCNEGTG